MYEKLCSTFKLTRIANNSSSKANLSAGTILNDRWKIVSKIGRGGFSTVYESKEIETRKRVAIKVQPTIATLQADNEAGMYRALKGTKHFPHFYGSGIHGEFIYIVIELLGPNLTEWRYRQPRKVFSISTGVRCFIQAMEALQALHEAGYVHRDVKPDNMATGASRDGYNCLYILDFGMCCRYKNRKGSHEPPNQSRRFVGTKRYASLNAHNGISPCRGDDMWSLLYSVIEMVTGKLPWSQCKTKERIKERKIAIAAGELCKNLPGELTIIHNALQRMKFGDRPNYEEFQQLLQGILRNINATMEDPYDWEKRTSALQKVKRFLSIS